MNIREILKHDISKRKQVIAESDRLIAYWERQLHAHSYPIPRSGIDYAYGKPDLGRLKAAGNTFICRYLGGTPNKDLTYDEALRLSHAGFDIVVVFESIAERAMDGEGAGRDDAIQAQTQLDRIGAPHAPVYFACDWEVLPSEFPNVRSYFAGVRKHLGFQRTGVYGGYAVVHELMSLDNVKYGWQTYAWSGGRWSPHAQLRQYQNDVNAYGVNCDLDRALAVDFGQFRRA